MDIRSTLFCSLIALGTVAHAEGLYILGSAGQTNTKLKDISKSDLDSIVYSVAEDFGLDASTSLDRSDTGFKFQIGYQFSPNFAIEGGYADLGQLEYKYAITDGVDSSNGKFSWETQGWNIDGVLILPVNAGFSLLGKVGFIRAETKFKLSIDGEKAISEEETKVAPLFGLGVAWNFYQGLSARVEWERFFNVGEEDDLTTGLDIDLYSVGLSYQF